MLNMLINFCIKKKCHKLQKFNFQIKVIIKKYINKKIKNKKIIGPKLSPIKIIHPYINKP